MSTITTNNKSDPSNSTTLVSIVKTNTAVCFYIANEQKWMLDSGYTNHITNDLSDFSEYHLLPTPRKAYFADKTTHVSYVGIGTVSGKTRVNGQEKAIILHDVLHSPELRGQFFSILKIDKKGFTTTFSGSGVLSVRIELKGG